MVINLQKWGNSQGIRIPKNILNLLKWENNESLSLSTKDDKIIIQKHTPRERKNINELFKNFSGTYKKEDINWGGPAGNEVW